MSKPNNKRKEAPSTPEKSKKPKDIVSPLESPITAGPSSVTTPYHITMQPPLWEEGKQTKTAVNALLSLNQKKGGMEDPEYPETVPNILSKDLIEKDGGLKQGDVFQLREEYGDFRVLSFTREGDDVYIEAKKIDNHHMPFRRILFNLADDKYNYHARFRRGGGSKKRKTKKLRKTKRRKSLKKLRKKGGMEDPESPETVPSILSNELLEKEGGLKEGEFFRLDEWEDGYSRVLSVTREGDNVFIEAEKVFPDPIVVAFPFRRIRWNLAYNRIGRIQRSESRRFPGLPPIGQGGSKKRKTKRRKPRN